MSDTHQHRVASRRCVGCGAGLLEEWTGQRCPECKAAAKERTKRWRAANPGKALALSRVQRARRVQRGRDAGLCLWCGDPAEVVDGEQRDRCAGCREYHGQLQVARERREAAT